MVINKFMVKKDLIEVSVPYVEVDGGEILIIKRERVADKIKLVKAKFARPNYKLFNIFMEGSIKQDANGDSFVDQIAFKQRKFRTLLRGFEDHDGTNYPLNQDFFDGIIPDLAIALVDEFDKSIDMEHWISLKKINAIPQEVIEDTEAVLNNIWGNKKEEENTDVKPEEEAKPEEEVKDSTEGK